MFYVVPHEGLTWYGQPLDPTRQGLADPEEVADVELAIDAAEWEGLTQALFHSQSCPDGMPLVFPTTQLLEIPEAVFRVAAYSRWPSRVPGGCPLCRRDW